VRFLLIAFSAFLLVSAAAHAELAGAAVTISGDTIEVQGRRVRLYGVMAPGLHQLCVGAQALRNGGEAEARSAHRIFVGDLPRARD